MTAARRLATFIETLRFEAIPAEVVEAAKLHLVDVVGCALAAAGLETASYIYSSLDPGTTGEALAFGHGSGVPAASAALVNGTLAHALDFDDTHGPSICHISAAVAPAALATAQATRRDGKAFIEALVAGNEVVARIGTAAAPAYMQQGFHPTSVCGVFGATAASGRLLGLGVEEIGNALGIAGSMASGLFEYLGDGSATKALHPGWAAHAGVLAAQLAGGGGTGPSSVLDGRFGVLATHFRLSQSSLDKQLSSLGTDWETPRIAFKPYPACHFVHAPIDAARAAIAGRTVAADEIDHVLAYVPEPAIPLVLEPRAGKVDPRTPYEAKFSLQFSVAAMLTRGMVDLATYTASSIRDEETLALAKKVEYSSKSFKTYPQWFPAAIAIRMANGDTFSAELAHQRGSIENPMSPDEVKEKFRATAAYFLASEDVSALMENLMAIDAAENLVEPLALTQSISRGTFGKATA